MHKLLALVGMVGLLPTLSVHAYGTLPDNPIAFENCTAKVKVDVARLRSGPSLDSKILGVKMQDSPLFVNKICGKWVQVTLASGDTAYMAAYLLTFPADEILEKYKRASPTPALGKKARVKWAHVNYRQLPSTNSAYLGRFNRNDEVAVLNDLGNGWSLIESQNHEGNGLIYGFITNGALAPPLIPDPIYWSTPLAKAHNAPPKLKEPVVEGVGEYCARTAWTPELFVLELKAHSHRHMHIDDVSGENLVATR